MTDSRWLVWYGLPVLCAVVLAGCGDGGSGNDTGGGVLLADEPPPQPVDCGPGLAAVDMAGTCRARPNPTAGALEVDPNVMPQIIQAIVGGAT